MVYAAVPFSKEIRTAGMDLLSFIEESGLKSD